MKGEPQKTQISYSVYKLCLQNGKRGTPKRRRRTEEKEIDKHFFKDDSKKGMYEIYSN